MASLAKKIIKGNAYYYIVQSKRVKGKPRPIVVQYLGTIENILKHYSTSKKGEVEYKSYSHGAVFALWKIAHKYNILERMREYFSDKKRAGIDVSKSLLLAAIHRAIEPGSKRSFADFAKETTLPQLADFKPEKLTSQHFWDQMDTVSLQQIEALQKNITVYLNKNGLLSLEKLSFDTTNFFTYIDSANVNVPLAQRGHNKQKRDDLRQFSLALMVSKNLFIPLSSFVYEGNMTDMGTLCPYLDYLKRNFKGIFHPEKTTLVFDKGCCSKTNLKKIKEEKFHYISAFSLYHKKDLTEIPLDEYNKVTVKNRIVPACRKEDTIWGNKRTIILYFSQKLYTGQIRGLNGSIQKKKAELNELRKKLKNPRTGICKEEQLEKIIYKTITGEHGREIFNFSIKKKPLSFEYFLDEEKYNSIVEGFFGKKVIITDRFDWSTEEILEAYFGQSEIERVFKHLKDKDHHSVRPQYHWTDQKIQTHVFICLLGFLLTSLLQKELQMKDIVLEKEHLLEILRRVRQMMVLHLGSKKKRRKSVEARLEQMDEDESEIYQALLGIINEKFHH